MLAGKKSADGAFNTTATAITRAIKKNSHNLEHGNCYGTAQKKKQKWKYDKRLAKSKGKKITRLVSLDTSVAKLISGRLTSDPPRLAS